jgi:hypothetical protein
MRVVQSTGQRVARTALLINAAALASFAHWTASIAHAQAEGPDFELQWSAPPACMSEAEARSEVSALIRAQRDAGERARARVLIEGTDRRGYVAQIEIARGASTGERELRGSRCDAIADAAVLIVAMAIDPEGASARAAAQSEAQAAGATKQEPLPVANSSRASERETPSSERAQPEAAAERAEQRTEDPADRQEPEEEVRPDEEEPVEEDEPSDPRRAGRLVLGARGSGDVGSLTHATIGGGLLGGVHWQHLRLELQGLAYAPQVEARSPAPGSSEVALYTGALTGCLDLVGSRDQPRALGTCAAIEGGLSRGTPLNISGGRASSAFWLAGFVGIDARQRIAGPAHVRLLAEVGLPVLRPSYEIEPFGRVFRASPVLGRFGISAFVLFP